MKSDKKRITVIGAGPGGYEAAIMASKLGAEVTVIEKESLGGTCLNKGCIPTKVYLATAEVLHNARHAKTLGIEADNIHLSHQTVLNNKNKRVKALVKGVESLFKENNITYIEGQASFKDPYTLLIEKKDGGSEEIRSDSIIIATGSEPVIPAVLNYDGKQVITSNELLEIEDLPESIIIIGGNIVATEVGQYLARFGVKVTIIEALERIVPFEDPEVSRELLRSLKKDRIKVLTKTRVEKTKINEDSVTVITEDGKEISADKILVCIGRKPYTENLNLKKAGIKTDPEGFIITDSFLKTSASHIYAIGDVINSPMLAHMASHEGTIAAENAVKGDKLPVSYKAVPRCIYTDPEVAAVGVTEEELKEENKEYKTGTFKYNSLGKAHAINKPLGFVKVITDQNDKIIGACIVGARASEELTELTLAVELGLSATKLGNIIHAHPTLSEAVKEACRDVNDLSLNKI